MEDRFLFRRFWEDEKKMYYVYNLQPLTKEDEKITHTMQCTGLKDKNGKLIYEGDIVKFKHYQDGFVIGTIEWSDSEKMLQVIYNDPSTYDNRKNWHYLSQFYLEVIGNIYENPELLNEEE